MDVLGLKGSKLISDIIKESSKTRQQRENAILLCDEKRILWVVGIKISKYALASAQTNKKLRITVIPRKEVSPSE